MNTDTFYEIQISPFDYVENSQVSFPNAPMIIFGNGASLTIPSGMLIINPNLVIEDLNILGNITLDSTSSGRTILRDVNLFGNLIINSDGIDLINSNIQGTSLSVNTKGKLMCAHSKIASAITSGGVLDIDSSELMSDSSSFAIVSSSGSCTVTNCIIYNSVGGGIFCDNGADGVVSVNRIVNNLISSVGSSVSSGNSKTVYSKNYMISVN